MTRTKTLSLPLITALLTSAVVPASAQIALSLSSIIDYRQNQKGVMKFGGGDFRAVLTDGSSTNIGVCAWYRYIPPGFYRGLCAPGTTGLITSGTVGNVDPNYPYLLVTSVYPALAISPREEEKAILYAAPASTLPRPQAGFTDDSYSLFFNLTTTEIREYIVTRYYQTLSYAKNERNKFREEIVPGVYYYSFPSLNDPERPAPISAVIYPMLEGVEERNNTTSGFVFTKVNGNKWNKKGFAELSYLRPNSIKWFGTSPSNVFANVDTAYFSIKGIQNQSDPNSTVVTQYARQPISIFPPYQNGQTPEIILANSYVQSFTIPPIFNSGTTGVAQVEFKRNFKTGGVTYDYSRRLFQIPVVVVDRYTEYQDYTFEKLNSTTDLLADTDGDGYNNLNEWILDSNANVAGSVPIPPRPDLVTTFDPYFYYFYFFSEPAYFGFDIEKKLGTKPGVAYTLQVSKDRGRTWQEFTSSTDWSVETLRTAAVATQPKRAVIQVRSLYSESGFYYLDGTPVDPAQPPGTENDIYRVKVTLKKKK